MIWGCGPSSSAASRLARSSDGTGSSIASPFVIPAIRAWSETAPSSLRKIRFLRSTGVKISRWETIISDFPSTSTP